MKKIILIIACISTHLIQSMEISKTEYHTVKKQEFPSLKTLCIEALCSEKNVLDPQTLLPILSTLSLSLPPDVKQQLLTSLAKKMNQPETLKILVQNARLLRSIDEQVDPDQQFAKKIIEMSPAFQKQKIEQLPVKLKDNKRIVYAIDFPDNDRLDVVSCDESIGGQGLLSTYKYSNIKKIKLLGQLKNFYYDGSDKIFENDRKETCYFTPKKIYSPDKTLYAELSHCCNLMSAHNGQLIKLLNDNRKRNPNPTSFYRVNDAAFSKNNSYFAYGSHFVFNDMRDPDNGRIWISVIRFPRIYVYDCSDINNIILIKEITDPKNPVKILSFSPDEKYLFSLSKETFSDTIAMYDCTQIKNGDVSLIKHFSLNNTVNSMAISPNSNYLALGCNRNTVYLYPLAYENYTLSEVLALLIQEENLDGLTNPELENLYKTLSKKIELPAYRRALFTGAQWLRTAKHTIQDICSCKDIFD